MIFEKLTVAERARKPFAKGIPAGETVAGRNINKAIFTILNPRCS